MNSKTGKRADELGVKLSSSIKAKFELLEKLVVLFKAAKSQGEDELNKNVKRVKTELLIGKLGCSEAVADHYIKSALERL